MVIQQKPTVVFFGSGPVAAESLELLVQSFTIEAVITKPQPAHHKQPFPVLEVAKKLGLKILTPNSKQELSALFATKPVTSPIGIVIDYGFIISQDVIDYFPYGIVNSHFSLLPEWRGADPITFSILSGQQQTGVSIMLLVAALDEGPLLSQTPFVIPNGMTTPQLTHELIRLSYESLTKVIPLYLAGQAMPADQIEVTIAASKQPTYSRKLTKDDGLLHFSKPATGLEREVRAYIDWPKSRTMIGDKLVVITAAHAKASDNGDNESSTGTIQLVTGSGGKQFGFVCSDGLLVVDRLKPAGKNEMTAAAFLAGYGHLL